MNGFLLGLLTALASTNQPVAVGNFVAQTTGVTIQVPDPDDPVEREFQKLLEQDDLAAEVVDTWIRENSAIHESGTDLSQAALSRRIKARFAAVRDAYEDFINRHPDHARGRLAYGSFLNEIHEEDAAFAQWEKARELDPNNPAAWNNLANYHGHNGQVKRSFEYFARAIELNPVEPIYYQNFATTVFLFRKDAREFYGIDEQRVFDKALDLYRKSLALTPGNFVLLTDYAMTFYGIRPFRTDDALAAWQEALKVAPDEVEREGIYIHLARANILAGRYDEARRHLTNVTREVYKTLKARVLRNLEAREQEAGRTNAPAAVVGTATTEGAGVQP